MQIHCENCNTAIPGPNINIQDKLAVCPQCGSVFSFADHLTRKPRKSKPPRNIMIQEQDTQLEIRFRWMQVLKPEEHWFTLLCLAGIGVLGGLAAAMFDGMDTVLEGVLGIGFVLAAMAALYMVLVILLNQVRVTIDEQMIHAQHKPLPFGNKNVQRRDVVGVTCAVASYNRDNPNSETVDYNVQLVRHDGSHVTLVNVRRDVAFYITQVIENYLDDDSAEEELEDEPLFQDEPLTKKSAT
jgi:hypothetical protein